MMGELLSFELAGEIHGMSGGSREVGTGTKWYKFSERSIFLTERLTPDRLFLEVQRWPFRPIP